MTMKDDTLSAAEAPERLPGRAVSATLDAGAQNCATLILGVRQAITSLASNDVLAVVAYDASADLDLQAWCRMTGNHFLGKRDHGYFAIYYLEKSGGE